MPLILTDRSRFKLGWSWCSRARYLEYHSGPTGYGIRLKSSSLPLVTGIIVHQGLAEIIQGLAAGKSLDDRSWMRPLVAKVVARYKIAVERRGLQITGAAPETEELRHLIKEQSALCEGLLWGAVRVFLPWLLTDFRIIRCEVEEEYVIACTCGLGSGVGGAQEHEARECQGVLVMLRPDLILQSVHSEAFSVCDFKTGASVKYASWSDGFEHDVQLGLGALGAERSLGVEISEAYVFGLHKGARKSEYQDGAYKGPRRQDSVMCYAYRRPANPPHWEEEWRADWRYVDEQGKNRTLQGKGFDRAPVWEARFKKPPEYTDMEFWVFEVLSLETVRENFVVSGPFQRQRHLIANLLDALEHEELRWVDRNWKVYEALAAAGGRMDDPEVVKVLNREVPQSWDCRRYNTLCQFAKLCRQETGWGDPLESGQYELRRPHHEPELKQMIARGIEPPPEQWESEEEVE